MKVLALNGSPKGKDSTTHIMIQSLFDGMNQAGASTQEIFLTDKNIQKCTGCFHCWKTKEMDCVLKDDMIDLIKLMIESDLVVYATPIHWDIPSADIKNFIDRLMITINPTIAQNHKGEYIHGDINDLTPKIQTPNIVLLANSGLPGQEQFEFLSLFFKNILRHFNSKIIAEIYRDQGPLFLDENPNPYLKSKIQEYQNLLVQAGKEIIEENQILDITKEKLKEPLIPIPIYVEEINKYFANAIESKK